jgi:hypothetical protein
MDWYDDDYDDWNGGRSQRGYRSQHVTFYRPDRDTETKDIGWCLSNGFHEIYPGLWSGDWYYRHHPNFKKEREMEREKRKAEVMESAESREERRKKERRAELLDDIYGGCYSPSHRCYDAARRELALLEGNLGFNCPLQGCQSWFVTESQMQEHLSTSSGKGHVRYRMENNIDAVENEFLQDNTPILPSTQSADQSKQFDDQSTTPRPLSPTQADIRSFFKPKASTTGS